MDLRQIALRLLVPLLCAAAAAAQPPDPGSLAVRYALEVDRALTVPPEETQRYGLLADALAADEGVALGREYVVVVDRDAQVQALLLLWRDAPGEWRLVGASPVSSGAPGSVDYFETPEGVFLHTPVNADFRSEGAPDREGLRVHGRKGLRVFDFGWQLVRRSWGHGEPLEMRLQMHAPDAETLEPRLGLQWSRGNIWIPASLDVFLDVHGILDADYERALRSGRKQPVLRDDRTPAAGAGRYLVVVDTGRRERPDWSPAPWRPLRRR